MLVAPAGATTASIPRPTFGASVLRVTPVTGIGLSLITFSVSAVKVAPSEPVTVTLIFLPISASLTVKVFVVAPSIGVPSAAQANVGFVASAGSTFALIVSPTFHLLIIPFVKHEQL